MQVILIILFFLVVIPLLFKFPKIFKAILGGIFGFLIFFIKSFPDAINKASNGNRKD